MDCVVLNPELHDTGSHSQSRQNYSYIFEGPSIWGIPFGKQILSIQTLGKEFEPWRGVKRQKEVK